MFASLYPIVVKIIASFTALLKKNVTFEWNYKHKKKFLELKKHLTEAPFLKYSDPSKPYQLETDVSDMEIGAVLYILTPQEYKPVAYKSKILSKSE